MKTKYKIATLTFFLCITQIIVHADSVQASFDSMDKVANALQKQSTELAAKIKDQERKIAEAENAKLLKVNYFWPLLGGAVAGITLAIIIRRKKKK